MAQAVALERVIQDVCSALLLSSELDDAQVEVVAENERVLIRGKVPSERARFIALEVARQAAGAWPVDGELEVSPLLAAGD